MKKTLVILITAFSTITLLSVTGCKKSNNTETDYSSDFTAQTEDETFFSAEDDAVSNDANVLIEEDASFAGRTASTICDATVTTSSTATTRILTITYNGQNCVGQRTRTGAVTLILPKEKKWRDAGTQVSITYQNLKITRTTDNKAITLNGTKTVTNVSGGELKNLSTLRTIVHAITSSGLNITFSDGSKRDWQIAKQRVFTFNNGIVIATTGTHTEATASNISEWGISRFGSPFSVQITEPMVIRQDCDFRLVSGKITYSNVLRPLTITFGLNASGVATGCPGAGRYYYKLEWTGILNTAHSIILPY